MNVVDTAITWILGIEQGNHGYNQNARTGPDYDCSSLVTHAYIAAGIPLDPGLYTGSMLNGFPEQYFEHIPYDSTMHLNPGDVIFAHRTGLHHAIMYIVDEIIVQASQDERGEYVNGQPGDQTGNEINRSTLNRSKKWQWVLRYKYDVSTMYHSSDDIQRNVIDNTVNPTGDPNYRPNTGLGLTVYRDVRNDHPNSRHDMTIREIGYFTENVGFTETESQITISAINYTTLLGNLYDQFATYYPYGYSANTDRLSGNIKICIDYFKERGLNPAVACGITACIFNLSGIGTLHDGGGICDWQGKYRQDMHTRVSDWETNLSGQLDYLWEDLCINYSLMLKLFGNVPNTDNGARQAAYRFMVSYRYTDQPQDVDTELSRAEAAQVSAVTWFHKIVIIPLAPEGTSVTSPESVVIPIHTDAFNILNPNYDPNDPNAPMIDDTTLLPSPLQDAVWSFSLCPYEQLGIDTNFTSYSYWCDRFGSQSSQYKLAQIWKNQYRMTCDRGIATIGGYYLAAVTETFGVVGDALCVTLENGEKINIIIADSKSSTDSNYCRWGHLQNGKVNVIEWEIVKVSDTLRAGRPVAVLADYNTAGYPPDISGWKGVPVSSIKHLGKKFNISWG